MEDDADYVSQPVLSSASPQANGISFLDIVQVLVFRPRKATLSTVTFIQATMLEVIDEMWDETLSFERSES